MNDRDNDNYQTVKNTGKKSGWTRMSTQDLTTWYLFMS